MNRPPFKKHLANIREAKHHTQKILDITNPGHSEAEGTLALAWEALFDHFCSNPNTRLTDLNTISSIIHKLTASYTQIKSIEFKSRELFLKEDSHKLKHLLLQSSQSPQQSIPEKTFIQIEQELKLL